MSVDATVDGSAADERDAPLLEIRGLKKHFAQADGMLNRLVGETGTVRAVDGVDLTVREGETLAVVGESGCGKSTLGQTLLNLHTPTDGEVRYRGTDIAGLSERKMRPYRRQMQMIFQNPLASLNPRQTVQDILVAPMEVHDIGDSHGDRVDRAADVLTRVGLQAQHLNRYPHQFSGGQQQRIALARVLTLEPEFVVADEPTSALDVSVQAQILNLLEDLQADLGLSMLFITHDLSVVRHVADRVAVMYLGEVVETAPVEELFDDPSHPYTQSLLSSVPRINPDARTDRILLEGTVPSPLHPPSGCRFHTRCPQILPPDDWRGTQEQFRALYTFRTRVEDGDIDADDVRARVGDDASDEAVARHVVRELLSVPVTDLPEDARATVRSVAEDVVAGDEGAARRRLEEAVHSPCADTHPTHVSLGGDHEAQCLLVEEEASTD